MDTLMQWDLSVILTLQVIPGLTGVMRLFTFLGNEEFFLLLLPLLYWCVNSAAGARLAIVLLASNSLSNLLKLAFHSPRPYWVDTRVQALSAEPSYGLPSGHAMNGVSVWGFLAAQLKQRWAWAAALVLIALISLSRLYLGVHFVNNVLGGWIFGGALLWAFLRWETPARAWLKRLDVWRQIGLAFAVSLVYLGLVAATLTLIARTPDPSEWGQVARAAVSAEESENAYDPRNVEGEVNSAGLIFGLGAGLALASRWARFDAGGPWGKRIARFVVGLIGVLVIWRGLALVFPEEPFLLAMTLRYLRYALTIFWVLYLAPWVFMKMKLAAPQPA